MTPVDLIGQTFGRLRVLEKAAPNRFGNLTWLCACECGGETVVASGKLRRGHTRSCGCLLRDKVAGLGLASRLAHGHSAGRMHSRAYSTWHGMKQRCLNPNHSAFEYYGGRGITVCERWMAFEDFLADMGEPAAGMSIDRIDVNGNYKPGNCRWATVAEQRANQRPRRKAA